MGIDNEDGGDASDDEWQRLLAGGSSDVKAAPQGTNKRLAKLTSQGAVPESSLKGISPVSHSPLPLVLPEIEPWRLIGVHKEVSKGKDNSPQKVNILPDGSDDDKEEDPDVFTLKWLEDANQSPKEVESAAHTAATTVSSAPSRSGSRPTAVKSMPFRPPDFRPDDIILKGDPPSAKQALPLWRASPKPVASLASPKTIGTTSRQPGNFSSLSMLGGLGAEKHPTLGALDLSKASPPLKAPRLEIRKPGDLLRHMTGALKKTPQTAPLPAEEPKEDISLSQSDKDGRDYNWTIVAVNFAGVGSNFVRAVRGKTGKDYRDFDWEGVRLCVKHLRFRLGLKVVGISSEDLLGADGGGVNRSYSLPMDIKMMCESVERATATLDSNPRCSCSAQTLLTACKRNCRFVSDDISDRLQALTDSNCRSWLRASRRKLLVRFFFSPHDGHFETPDGGVPMRA